MAPGRAAGYKSLVTSLICTTIIMLFTCCTHHEIGLRGCILEHLLNGPVVASRNVINVLPIPSYAVSCICPHFSYFCMRAASLLHTKSPASARNHLAIPPSTAMENVHRVHCGRLCKGQPALYTKRTWLPSLPCTLCVQGIPVRSHVLIIF